MQQALTYESASKKGHQAVLIAESFTTNFKPLSHSKPKCLFPLANIPMLFFQIQLLAQNNVTKIIIVSARDPSLIRQEVDKIKQYHKKGKFNLIEFKFHRLSQTHSLCQALRELEQDELHDDFILLSGDIVSNADLQPALRQHYLSKTENRNFPTIITKVFKRMPFSSQLRDPSQELVLTIETQTNTIVDYGQYSSQKQTSMQLNKKHIALKRSLCQYQLYTDVVDTEIQIVNKELFKHLQEDVELKQLKDEFIVNLNQSELTDDKVMAHFLPDKTYFGQVLDPRTYQVITRDVIARSVAPYCVDFPAFELGVTQVLPFNRYYGKDVKRHLKSHFSDNIVVGSCTTIGPNTSIESSVIGQHCQVGANVTIKNSIIWGHVIIEDGCNIENALIAENCVIGAGSTISAGCMLDKDVGVVQGKCLENSTVASCFTVSTNTQGDVEFKPCACESQGDFTKGQVCYLPLEMTLSKSRQMGQPSPYALQLRTADEESDLEDSEDDDYLEDEYSDEQLAQACDKMIREVFANQTSCDVVKMNMTSIKHQYSKTNQQFASCIIASMLAYAGSPDQGNLVQSDMKASKKKQVLEQTIEKFHDLLVTFVHTVDDQVNVIHQICVQCSKLDSLKDIFHLIVQLWFGQEVLSSKAVLSWIEGKRQQDTLQSALDEEEDDQEQLNPDTVKKFLSDMAKFEEYLRSQEAPASEDAAAEEAGEEYYDEEAY